MNPLQKKTRAVFVVLNDKGLHTRPSAELVKCAAHFAAHISLSYRNYVVSAKSILGILMLAAGKGAKVTVEAVGEDADRGVKTLVELAKNRFNVKY